MKVRATIDIQEKQPCTERLKLFIDKNAKNRSEFEVVEASLPAGDLLIEIVDGDHAKPVLLLERKSFTDFRETFIAKRWWVQMDKMKSLRSNAKIEKCGVLIEGKWPSDARCLSDGNPNYQAIFNILKYTERLYGYRAYFTESMNGTSRLMYLEMQQYLKQAKSSSIATAKLEKKKERAEKKGVEFIQPKFNNPLEREIWQEGRNLAERTVTKVKITHKTPEKWIYLSMFLTLFDGISMERSLGLSKKFNNSFKHFNDIFNEDKQKFREMLEDKDNPNFGRRVPTKCVDRIMQVLGGELEN
jgi:ERCC4-type nuclease